ncbi:hypothetical protein A5782_14010 [Mycobacterium sp. 852002-40037_SCH5390672]|nr:hypothetical protein A5782_14010 [Mycobacterium sp. 852002-40037_SCH5390672]
MASNGPRDDFHNQPTQHGDFGVSEQPPTGEIPPPGPSPYPPEGFEHSDDVDPFDQEPEPTPWYRKRGMLIAWLVSVVILIALIVFGIIELIHGETVNHVPKTTTSTTPATTTTTPTTTTTTTTSSPSSSAEQPPAQQPPQQQQPTGGQTQQPSHHHHLPQLPSVITIPGVPTAVTVPPGLR